MPFFIGTVIDSRLDRKEKIGCGLVFATAGTPYCKNGVCLTRPTRPVRHADDTLSKKYFHCAKSIFAINFLPTALEMLLVQYFRSRCSCNAPTLDFGISFYMI